MIMNKLPIRKCVKMLIQWFVSEKINIIALVLLNMSWNMQLDESVFQDLRRKGTGEFWYHLKHIEIFLINLFQIASVFNKKILIRVNSMKETISVRNLDSEFISLGIYYFLHSIFGVIL